MDRSVFVTGATGVIGRRVVPQLVALGHRVTAIGRAAEKRAWLETAGARAVALDLVDAGALQQALAGQDVVINLATHMPSSTFKMLLPWSWKENDRVRREGSAALADAALAAGVSRFIQESFAPVYEGGGERWIDETWPVDDGIGWEDDRVAVAVAADEQQEAQGGDWLGAELVQRARGDAGGRECVDVNQYGSWQ
jgi:nucleoside-diphosphate-sugar epimerase